MCERDTYRARTNQEVYRTYQELDLVTVIKAWRLKWLGHVSRMEDHKQLSSKYKLENSISQKTLFSVVF
jgi:hypothetical protein